jgi:mRNA interferase RelE/StbE
MNYRIELKPKAEKDLKRLSGKDYDLVVEHLKWLEDDLRGNVKRLTHFTPEYRMRAGNWRVLFEVENNTVVVYRILKRSDAYR